MKKLRVTEIFYSLQGETRTVGLHTVFIRLTGCPLRCQYCDTAYAFSGGNLQTLDAVLSEIEKYKAKYVTVTGGEPLAQSACLDLLTMLCDRGYSVSLETSGALNVSNVDSRVVKVVDFKTPGSNEVEKNDYSNIEALKLQDQVKFVVCNRADYDWAKVLMEQHRLLERCDVLFSPSHDELENATLAGWIIEDNLPVRFQLQMHKYIWGDESGR